ncbi:hypothetical protein M426DRAFT_324132 [Hypoxylon sp. CI-4A]|nr:hypothetical protein M426DRAFT_324132 [Hypoxylon sp. CI-4A]
MSLLARTKEATLGLIDPWIFLSISARCLPGTLRELIREQGLGVLLDWSKVQNAWFSHFWGRLAGPETRKTAGARVVPLLQGRASGGEVVEETVERGVSGTVLEVGAGSGLWVDVYRQVADIQSDAAAETEQGSLKKRRNVVANSNGGARVITRIYGVEPNHDQHENLRRAISKAGLEDVYQIAPVGIEDLDNPEKWDGRIQKGSVDCIMSILCLCSIPEPEKNIRELYSYLKDGGRWYVYEHVRCEYSWYMRVYQRILNLFWPHFIGGCLLCRQTEKTIREAGPWKAIDVGQPSIEPWYQVTPHILGVFTK